MPPRPTHLLAIALIALAAALAAPAAAFAAPGRDDAPRATLAKHGRDDAPRATLAKHGGGDDEARVEGDCGSGASSELRLKADDGAIEVELRVDSRRSGERWRVVLVHERRVAWRANLRTRSGGDLRVRRNLPDYGGADEITALASGPRGLSCRATAVLSGS